MQDLAQQTAAKSVSTIRHSRNALTAHRRCSSYYELTYLSGGPELARRIRKVSVKTRRVGVQLAYRAATLRAFRFQHLRQ